MSTLEYKSSNGAKWPVTAELSGVEFIFTGSFDLARVQKERTVDSLARLFRGIAWVLSLGLLAFLYTGYEFLYLDGELFFIFYHHWANLLGWVGSLAALYLWAEKLHKEAEHAEKRAITPAKLDEWQKNKKPVDVFGLFTEEAKNVWDRAMLSGNGSLGVCDVLLSLLQDRYVGLAFLRFGVNPEEIKISVKNLSENNIEEPKGIIGKLPFAALDEAVRLHNKSIDSLMLFTALLREMPDDHPIAKMFFALDFGQEQLETIASWIFNLGILVEEDKIFRRLAKHRSDKGINRALTAVPTPYLDQFSKDLTLAAKHHQLPLTRGREVDTDKVIQLLAGGRSVLVVGGKGTGRSTVLHNLAYKMTGEQVPMHLQDTRLVELELAGILGGKVPPEQIIINLFKEAEHSGNMLFALSDAQELAKAKGAEGLPVLEVLLSHLANSRIQLIATATPESLQTSLRSIPRISQALAVYELTGLDHFGIVTACAIRASELEAGHKVFFQYQAIEEAVALTNSLATQDTGQPEKAIEVLEAAADRAFGLSQDQRVITKSLIQKIVAEISHVPVEALSENESQKLLEIESELSKYVIGQKEAVSAVAESLRRARSGLVSGSRPLASFLFVGPTGVGKTEMARTLAKVYFGKPEYMLRLDMSEYQGIDGMRKLLGEGAEKSDTPFVVHLKTYPFCLFLLDELEKASDEVLNLFLAVLEDGRITTASGQTLDLTHTIIIATSNAGTKEIQEGLGAGVKLADIKATLMEKILINHYRTEFLNRFDGVILFAPLERKDVEQITRLQLQLVAGKLLEQKIRIQFSDATIKKIATEAFDPLLGARPVRRYIQDHVESVIAKLLLTKQLSRGDAGILEVNDAGEFYVSKD